MQRADSVDGRARIRVTLAETAVTDPCGRGAEGERAVGTRAEESLVCVCGWGDETAEKMPSAQPHTKRAGGGRLAEG